jgi:hypothetical protein
MAMIKCPNENLCVPNESHCFKMIPFDCNKVIGDEFGFQCPGSGICKNSPYDCESPKVCPPGYTQCADYKCVIGDFMTKCPKPTNCVND